MARAVLYSQGCCESFVGVGHFATLTSTTKPSSVDNDGDDDNDDDVFMAFYFNYV